MDNQFLDVAYSDKDLTDEEKEIIELEDGEKLKEKTEEIEEILRKNEEPEKEPEKKGEEVEPDKSEPEKETSDEKAEKPPEESGDGEKPEEVPEFLQREITDEVLSLYTEDERRLLEKYKGKSLADGLKALAHSQRLVGKKEISAEEYPALPDDDKTKSFIEEKSFERLRDKYSDKEMPEGGFESEEVKMWLRDLMDDDPLAYSSFIKDKEDISRNVEKDFKKAIHIAKNHTEINKTRLESEIEGIKTQLKEWGIEDPKDANIDLELKQQNGSYQNELLNNLLLDGDEPDPNVVEFYGKFPLITEGRLREKFFTKYGKQIISAIVQKQKANAIAEHERLKKEAPNTLAGGGKTGSIGGGLTLTELEKSNDSQAIKRAREQIERELGF